MSQIVRLRTKLSSINAIENFEALMLRDDIAHDIAQEIIERHQLPGASLKLFSEGTNIVFSYGNHTVIKIFPPFHLDQFKNELLVLKHRVLPASLRDIIFLY